MTTYSFEEWLNKQGLKREDLTQEEYTKLEEAYSFLKDKEAKLYNQTKGKQLSD